MDYVKRLRVEREAARHGINLDLLDEPIASSYERIRTTSSETEWWKLISAAVGRRIVRPSLLSKPVIQDWLADNRVFDAFRTLTKSEIVGEDTRDSPQREYLAHRYSDFTGEKATSARSLIDRVTEILVAGCSYSLSQSDRVIVGSIQELNRKFSQRFDSLEAGRGDEFRQVITTLESTLPNPRTDDAFRELHRISSLRTFDEGLSIRRIRRLLARLDADFISVDQECKKEIRIWAARLLASRRETLLLAQQIREDIAENNPDEDLTVIDALAQETQGNPDRAMRLVRDKHNPDARSLLFRLMKRHNSTSEALDWFNRQHGAEDIGFFAPVGWLSWAICEAETSGPIPLLSHLPLLEPHWDELPGLALLELSTHVAMLVPEEFRDGFWKQYPLYVGIRPSQGHEALTHYERAIVCNDFVRKTVRGQVSESLDTELDGWDRWLRLMDPNPRRCEEARNHVVEEMNEGDTAINAMPFVHAFEIDFPTEPLALYLHERTKLGGLNDNELAVQFFLNLKILSPTDVAKYIVMNRDRLLKVFASDFVTSIHVQAVAEAEGDEVAEELVREYDKLIDDDQSKRLGVMIAIKSGSDPRSQLEANYRRTGQLLDLINFINYLKQFSDYEALLPLTRSHFSRVRNVANALDVVQCLLATDPPDHQSAIHFLDDIPDLLEESQDLVLAKALALFHAGRLDESRRLNEAVMRDHMRPDTLRLDLGLAIALGDWDRIGDITTRAWQTRDRLAPHDLMRFAHVAASHETTPDRALQLVDAAIAVGGDDATVLAAAYGLHFKVGRERLADPVWLEKAVELSSTTDGPIWSVDIHEVTANWIPEREARGREIQEKWLAGEIPIGTAARFFNVPLARLFLHTTTQNKVQPDGRLLSVLPTISGTHEAVDLQSTEVIGLDITSIYVLAYLDFLKLTLDSFKRVTLAPNTMEWLFYERTDAAFHQPSRVDSAKIALKLYLSGNIIVENGQADESHLIDEFGEELALLFRQARSTNGIVVGVTPLHKAGTLLEQIADTSSVREMLMPLSEFSKLLRDAGHLSAHDLEHVTRLIQPDDDTVARFSVADLKRPIFLDRLAFQYLLDTNILSALAPSGIPLHIHEIVLEEMRSLSEAGETGRTLIDQIEGIRHVLREGIVAGKVSFTEHQHPMAKQRQTNSGFEGVASLMGASPDCDALLVDDRFINKFPRVESPNGSSTPIACVLDLLRLFLTRGEINDQQYFAARQKLRQGGFAFIPLESEELLNPISTVHFDDEDRLIENRELTVLRQTTARVNSLDFAKPDEALMLLGATNQAAVATIRALWETDGTTQMAFSRSNWIWDNIISLSVPNLSVMSQPSNATIIGNLLSVRIGMLLLPLPTWSEDVHHRYLQWIDTLISKFLPANSKVIDEALRSAREAISDLDVNQAAYGNLFFARLPESARIKMTDLFPDFAASCGVELTQIVSLGSGIKVLVRDLLCSATCLLDSNKSQTVTTLDKSLVRVVLNDLGDISIEIPPSNGDQPDRVELPHLNLLSPDEEVRMATFADITKRLGPTADYETLAENIAVRKPNSEEMSQLMTDLSKGVAASQSLLTHKLRLRQSLLISDFVFDSLAYYDRTVGPRPNEESVDAYIIDTLIPYRKQLIDRDLIRGLEICCHGAVHPSLLPAHWLTHISNDELWRAVDSIGTAGGCYFLLALLEICLTRRSDARFEQHAETLVSLLLDQDADYNDLYSLFFQLIFNQINLLENGTEPPPYWKRLAAWTQAGICIQAVTSTESLIISEIEDSLRRHITTAGYYANLADGRVEPMILASQSSKNLLQTRTLLALQSLRAQYDPDSFGFPGIDLITSRLSEETEQLAHGIFMPGPLAGHERPVIYTDADLKDQLIEASGNDVRRMMSGLMLASQVFRLSEADLEWVIELIQSSDPLTKAQSASDLISSLDAAATVAAANRSVSLADAVADMVVRFASNVTDEDTVSLTPLLLTAASAHDDENEWFTWLESQFVRVASNLPGPPDGAPRIFLECLDQLEIALPSVHWFHLRAKSIALAGSSAPSTHL